MDNCRRHGDLPEEKEVVVAVDGGLLDVPVDFPRGLLRFALRRSPLAGAKDPDEGDNGQRHHGDRDVGPGATLSNGPKVRIPFFCRMMKRAAVRALLTTAEAALIAAEMYALAIPDLIEPILVFYRLHTLCVCVFEFHNINVLNWSIFAVVDFCSISRNDLYRLVVHSPDLDPAIGFKVALEITL